MEISAKEIYMFDDYWCYYWRKKQKKVVVVREYGDVFDPNGKYVRYVLSKNSIRTDYRNS